MSGARPYPNGPEAGWGSEFVPLKKREVGSFILLQKISRIACCFGIRTFLKQYNCYESATIWYTDHQYLAQYSEIINNLWEIPLIFCNYAVRSCGTWRNPASNATSGDIVTTLASVATVAVAHPTSRWRWLEIAGSTVYHFAVQRGLGQWTQSVLSSLARRSPPDGRIQKTTCKFAITKIRIMFDLVRYCCKTTFEAL